MSYPSNTADVLLVAYPNAVRGPDGDYLVSNVGGVFDIAEWNEAKLGPKPTAIKVNDWGQDRELLPGGYIFSAAQVAPQVKDGTETLYRSGMPRGEVFASLVNGEFLTARVDVNDTQQSRLAGQASPPYFFLDVDGNPVRIDNDSDHDAFWLAMNTHTAAIFGTHAILIERLRALGVGQGAQADQIRADSAARTPQNVVSKLFAWMDEQDALTYALNQVRKMNRKLADEPIGINGHIVEVSELKELHAFLQSGEDDWPYWLQVVDDDPYRIGSAEEARRIVKRLGERLRRTRASGRQFVRQMRRASTRDELRVLIDSNAERSNA